MRKCLKQNKTIRLNALFFTRLIEIPIVLDYLEAKKREKVCDIACGSGELSFRIARKGSHVYGIDFSRVAIRSAKVFSCDNCLFLVGNAENIPSRSGIFDKVVCNCALEHFQFPFKALLEMNRILKLNGVLVLTVDSFSYPGIKKEITEKHRKIHRVKSFYTRENLAQQLENNGFKIVCNKYYLNSPITSFFFNHLAVKYNLSFIINILLSWIIFPLCLLSDWLFGIDDGGYCLAVKAKKMR